MKQYQIYIIAAVLAIVTSLPNEGQAYTLFEDDELTLRFSGLGEASARLNINDSAGGTATGYYQLNFARLVGQAVYADKGSVFLQICANTGDVRLVDARVSLTPRDELAFQLGHFQMPLSAEFLTSAGDLLFSRRAALLAVIPRRSLGAGLFTPGAVPNIEPEAGVAVGRVLVQFAERYSVHAALAEGVLGNDPDPITDERIFDNNRQFDLAFSLRDDRWHALVEGVYIFDGPGDSQPVGLHVNAARKFPVGEVDIEPALGYDFLHREAFDLHRATAAFNTY